MKLNLYTKENCPQCRMTKRFLTEKEIPFTECNIDVEPQYVDWLKEQGYRSVPILTDEANHLTIIGFRPDQLKALVR